MLAAASVLVASAAAEPSVLRVNLTQSDVDYTDPALSWFGPSWQIEYLTCAKLLNYPDAAAPEGARLMPEVAAAMPTVSADGLIYSFTLRDDFRFATGAAVTAEDVKATFDRVANPAAASPAAAFMTDIVGAQGVMEGSATSVSGVVASGNTLTVALTKPDADFPARVALPFFCILPAGTPPTEQQTPMTAGPYYVFSREPSAPIVLKRNPFYAGSRPHVFDEIVVTPHVDAAESVTAVRAGVADYNLGAPPDALEPELWNQYGPLSAAAALGHQQYFVNPQLTVRFLALNSSRPTFASVARRKAVNYALDRQAISAAFGPHAVQPTDQFLPPLLRGFQDEPIYPLGGPDLDTARAYMAAGGPPGTGSVVMYTIDTPVGHAVADIVRSNLAAIGLTVDVQAFSTAVSYKKCATAGEPFDICWDGWIADYPDPYNVLNTLFDGSTLRPTGNTNHSYFNDPTFNDRLAAAEKLAGDDRYPTYGQIDVDLAKEAAAAAPLGSATSRDFFAARIGCQVYQPVYGVDLAGLCVRPPVTVSPPPPPPPPPVPIGIATHGCAVPSVVGLSLPAARRRLRRAACSLGRVGWKYSKQVAKGRVMSQNRRRGAVLAIGASVDVIASKGRAPSRVMVCANGRTQRVSASRAKQLRSHGATLGACRKTKRR